MDSLIKKFEETLGAFIQQVQKKLEDHQATLQEYEQFFKKFEEVFPSYTKFVAHALDSLHALETMEKQLVQKISGDISHEETSPESVSSDSSVASESKTGDSRNAHTAASASVQKPVRAIRKIAPNAAPKTMLIVDDAEINRVLMGHYFKLLPVQLEFSGSGADAIEKCQKKKFDLILMDLQMKDMSGVEATQKIRVFEASCPIFAITNHEPTDAELQESIQAGCNRYLSKALTKEALVDQVSEQLFGV